MANFSDLHISKDFYYKSESCSNSNLQKLHYNIMQILQVSVRRVQTNRRFQEYHMLESRQLIIKVAFGI